MSEPLYLPDGDHGQTMLHCPICGMDVCGRPNHRCRPETLAAIDRAMKGEPTTPPPCIAERLRDGFAMLGNDTE